MIKKNYKISIAVLTYNRALILSKVLESLEKIQYAPLEIIVVDNHSSDETEAVVKTGFPNVKYFRMESNIGVGARNVGIAESEGDIIITIDDDIIGIDDKDIQSIIRLFDATPDLGAICFKVIDYSTGEICNWCHHYKKEEFCNKEFSTDEITEGAVAFRKSSLNSCSGLYPEYFFISHEGPDLLYRMLEAGYKTIFSPEICVKHRTAPQGRTNWRRYYYDTRNQIWLAARNFPVLMSIRYLSKGLTAMLIYSIRDGFVSYWFKGVRDAIMDLPMVVKNRKILSKKSLKILKDISRNRPGLLYMVRERFLKRTIKL
jgi:GT2 family glycosyltransferase